MGAPPGRVVEDHLAAMADFTHNVTVWGSGMPVGTGVELFTRARPSSVLTSWGASPTIASTWTSGLTSSAPTCASDGIHAPPELRRPTLRLTLDTSDDLALLRSLHAELATPPLELALGGVVDLLDRRPDLVAINAHVHQKTV